jgi:hypothetical protein
VSLEILKTHAFCAGCNYSPDFEEGNAIPAWAIRAVNEAEEREAADALNGVPSEFPDLDQVGELLARFPELSDLDLSESEGHPSNPLIEMER